MAMLRILLIIIFLIAALAVTVIVLLQEGKSAGLGSMTGSSTGGDSYWEKNKKHSLEGKFERWTKITAIVFILSAFIIMLIPNQKTGATTGTGVNQVGTESTQVDTAPESTDNAETDESAENADNVTTDTATDGAENTQADSNE